MENNELDELVSASEGLVARETITLPKAGKQVRIRSLMAGELFRISAAKDALKGPLTIALGTESATTGKLLFNPNDAIAMGKIGKLHWLDLKAISEAINRLSETDEPEGNDEEVTSESSPSSSSAPE